MEEGNNNNNKKKKVLFPPSVWPVFPPSSACSCCTPQIYVLLSVLAFKTWVDGSHSRRKQAGTQITVPCLATQRSIFAGFSLSLSPLTKHYRRNISIVSQSLVCQRDVSSLRPETAAVSSFLWRQLSLIISNCPPKAITFDHRGWNGEFTKVKARH